LQPRAKETPTRQRPHNITPASSANVVHSAHDVPVTCTIFLSEAALLIDHNLNSAASLVDALATSFPIPASFDTTPSIFFLADIVCDVAANVLSAGVWEKIFFYEQNKVKPLTRVVCFVPRRNDTKNKTVRTSHEP
jgi:hypothetical protein